jgi:prepilin-type N-terminal cleavage/methylation domain-containing protein
MADRTRHGSLGVTWEEESVKRNLQGSDIVSNSGPDLASRWGNTCPPSGVNRARSAINRAFTLIELLVVIAIIAVLAALLLPVLSIAKNRAQMATDLNNVHQILTAVHLYANDNHDYLPQGGADTVNGTTMDPIPNWCYGNPCSIPGTAGGTRGTYDTYYPLQVKSFRSAGYAKNNASLLSPYLKNDKVLRCPADVPNPLYYQRQVYITSYVWNFVVNGYAAGVPSVQINGTWYPITLKLGQFKPDDILLWENDETRVGAADFGQWCDVTSFPDEGISARHGKGATVGNFDGTAERMNLSDFYYLATGARYKKILTGALYGTGWSGGQSLPNRAWCNPIMDNGAH